MDTKTKEMNIDSMIAKTVGLATGMLLYLFSIDFTFLLDATSIWSAMGGMLFELFKVTAYGAMGAVGGILGRKILSPLLERSWKWISTYPFKSLFKKPKR